MRLLIPAGQSVGIVGRSGSGKSSLIAAILRLAELDAGGIAIDGIDVRAVAPRTLRSRVSVIPQMPCSSRARSARTSSARSTASTTRAAAAMDAVSPASSPARSASAAGRRGGSSLSAGRRQLVCLARALLRRDKVRTRSSAGFRHFDLCLRILMLTSPKVLVLDEALASVDARAEAIKRALATWFADATVLHVAHRLSAISDVERVLVFEDGALVEDGTPAALLRAGGPETAATPRPSRAPR